jgi:hypothetical protein
MVLVEELTVVLELASIKPEVTGEVDQFGTVGETPLEIMLEEGVDGIPTTQVDPTDDQPVVGVTILEGLEASDPY